MRMHAQNYILWLNRKREDTTIHTNYYIYNIPALSGLAGEQCEFASNLKYVDQFQRIRRISGLDLI
jgi:hypothetical protein